MSSITPGPSLGLSILFRKGDDFERLDDLLMRRCGCRDQTTQCAIFVQDRPYSYDPSVEDTDAQRSVWRRLSNEIVHTRTHGRSFPQDTRCMMIKHAFCRCIFLYIVRPMAQLYHALSACCNGIGWYFSGFDPVDVTNGWCENIGCLWTFNAPQRARGWDSIHWPDRGFVLAPVLANSIFIVESHYFDHYLYGCSKLLNI